MWLFQFTLFPIENELANTGDTSAANQEPLRLILVPSMSARALSMRRSP